MKGKEIIMKTTMHVVVTAIALEVFYKASTYDERISYLELCEGV